MPRSDAEPEASASPPGRLHLWRHRIRELRGQGSLDSDEGLGGDTVPPPPPAGGHVAPAGRAASHESGSLSDLEDTTGDGASPPLPTPMTFSKFRLGARRDKSLPPQPEPTRKQKPHRVSRLREFTDRLRWSRDEKSAAASPPGSSHKTRPRRPPQPPAQPAITEGRGGSEPGEGRPRAEPSISLRQRPVSDSDLAWQPAGGTVTSAVPPQQRSVPNRSASVSRVDACGTTDKTNSARRNATARTSSFSVGRAAPRSTVPQTLPRKLPSGTANAAAPAPSHTRQNSDSLVELGRSPSPLTEEDDEIQHAGNSHLLEAMLREIQLQSLSLQRRDSSGLLPRQSHSADGWPERSGRLDAADVSRAVSVGPQPAVNEVTRPADVNGGQKSVPAPDATPTWPAVDRDGSLVGGDGETASRTSAATDAAVSEMSGVAAGEASGKATVKAVAERPKLRRPLLPSSSDSGTSGDEPREPRFADLSPVIITHGQVIESPLISRAGRARVESTGPPVESGGPRVELGETDDWQGRSQTDAGNRQSDSRQNIPNTGPRMGGSKPCQREIEANDATSRGQLQAREPSKNIEESSKSGDSQSFRSSDNCFVENTQKVPSGSSPPSCKQTDSNEQSNFSFSSADVDKAVNQTPNQSNLPESSRKSYELSSPAQGSSECLLTDVKGQLQNPTELNDDSAGKRDSAGTEVSSDQLLDNCQEPANSRLSLDSFANKRSGSDDVKSARWGESRDPSSEQPLRSPPPLTRQNATGRSVSPFDPACPPNGESHQGVQQEQDNALKLSLDRSDPLDVSADKENIRQAVKKAVALLLNELNVDEDQEEPWYPGQTDPTTTQPSQSFATQDEEEPQLRRRGSTYTTKQPESKTVDVVRLSDTGLTVTASMAAADHRRPPLIKAAQKRFRSKSLSPSVLRRDSRETAARTEECSGGRRTTVTTGPSKRTPRVPFTHTQQRQRSFDLSGAEMRARDAEPRRRSFKKRPAIKAAAALSPSTDSVSSTSSDEQRVRGRGRPSRHGHVKLHAPRLRTVSDSATLRPLSAAGRLLPLTEQTAAQPDRRRNISPSPLAYDSEPDGPGRAGRRRLRGPYGELLEGKMSRAETAPPLGALIESASPSPSPRPGPRRGSTRRRANGAACSESAAATPRTRSSGSEGERSQRGDSRRASSGRRLSTAASRSDGELSQLPRPEQELTQLLSEALYDGVGPTARRMLAQTAAGQDQPGAQVRPATHTHIHTHTQLLS